MNFNRFTANAAQIRYCRAFRSNAAGNILVQAITLGHLPSLAAAREVVRQSMPMQTFAPMKS